MLEGYKHKPFTTHVNKKLLPINEIHFENLEEFNKLYKYAKRNFKKVDPTRSQAVPSDSSLKFVERYMVVKGNQRFELVIICADGCYRFVLCNKKAPDNTIKGSTAVREIYKQADILRIDLSPYITDAEKGWLRKMEIEPPHIEVMMRCMIGKRLKKVYHMDFKSSYASRIVEKYPELKPLYESMYKLRKENDGYYKHVLTNSIGCFQSEYCPDYYVRHNTSKYQFATLAKTAVNGTRDLINEYCRKLLKKGFIPVLTNTDGIWYYSETGKPYHDAREGGELGQWENDHCNCQFLMMSSGCYQYEEDGVVHSVVRGKSNLDAVNPDRSTWKFGYISRIKEMYTYTFDENKGVVKCQSV